MVTQDVMGNEFNVGATHVHVVAYHLGILTFLFGDHAVGEDHTHEFQKDHRFLFGGHLTVYFLTEVADVFLLIIGKGSGELIEIPDLFHYGLAAQVIMEKGEHIIPFLNRNGVFFGDNGKKAKDGFQDGFAHGTLFVILKIRFRQTSRNKKGNGFAIPFFIKSI